MKIILEIIRLAVIMAILIIGFFGLAALITGVNMATTQETEY